MPELPEVETVARSLRAHVVGRTIAHLETSGHSLRRPVDGPALARSCQGARIERVDRYGKYLLLGLSRGDVLLVHLGMSGQLLVAKAGSARPAHTHVVFGVGAGEELRYVDPRRFGVLVAYEPGASPTELLALGPDPLSDRFTAPWFAAEAASSRRDIKQFLLDQTRVAGLGNIYVAEALHQAGISPRRRADRVGAAKVLRLHASIQDVLRAAVERRGTSLRDYVDADGRSGENQHHLAVYGREGQPCRGCGTPIRRLVQGARSTFYCPRCQR